MKEAEYQPTIGLEIHVELKTKTKMFCDCPNETWKIGVEELAPNSAVCPICLGHPGTLPVINKEAVKMVLKCGLALNCEIAEKSKFDRKNYFYPDLAKGYQISQYDQPLCVNGYLSITNSRQIKPNNSQTFENNSVQFVDNSRKIRIRRVHLEEDTGKLSHPAGADYSLVDFNRAGVPLMELVTEPDIESGAEAKEFCQELQAIFRELEISDADMEKGQMRCEVNISLSNEPRIKTNGSRIVLKEESYKLMGLFFEIHKKLGSIYKEINYQDAIEEVLKREKISYVREKPITLKLDNLELSNLFADFVIGNQIIIEVKAKKFITDEDIRQASRYIKSLGLPLAIILNFKRQRLEYKRVINPLFENNSVSFGENSGSLGTKSVSFGENSGSLGTKVEIKNLNSFRAVERAIDYEIQRQSNLLEHGEKIIQETRGWDEKEQKTFSQRTKEESADYRYFPEPDLPPLKFQTAPSTSLGAGFRQGQTSPKGGKNFNNFIDLEQLKRELPELPMQKRERFMIEYGFKSAEAKILTSSPVLADYTEEVLSELKAWLSDVCQFEGSEEEIWLNNKDKMTKLVAGWLINKLGGLLTARKLSYVDNTITSENFAEFITMIFTRQVSIKNANLLLERMLETGGDPSNILADEDLSSAKTEDLEKIVNAVINKNPDQVTQFKAGKTTLLKFFIGQVMKESHGKTDPKEAEEMLIQKLG